jgi:hypothetical protein
MRDLPRDERLYPVPYTAARGTDGKYDFRVTDQKRIMSCAANTLCGVCGHHIGGLAALVGGPMSMLVSRAFTDAPMHPSCARYSLQMCPHLAAPKHRYSRSEVEVKGYVTVVNEEMDTERAPFFGLGLASEIRVCGDIAHPVFEAVGWVGEIEWWQYGKRYVPTPQELEAQRQRAYEKMTGSA